MSFFNLSDNLKKIKETYLIWLFPMFLITCFILIGDNNSYKSVTVGQKKSETFVDNSDTSVTIGLNYYENPVTIDRDDDELSKNRYINDYIQTSAEIESLYAKYAMLMDRDNRRVLYEKNGYIKAPMASTTKIMTLLVTLENANLEDVVTVSEYAASMPDVQLNIRNGEQYRLIDLLYSLMLESHNDSAVAIAEHVGGSVEGFAKLMNDKAKELGAYDTNFVTPNGLDHEDHYTTAYDLALIASYAVTNSTFCEIIRTPSYTFHEQTTGRSFTVNNKDRFLTSYPGAIGIKTGFTGNAGYCFVGAVDIDDKHLVSVVLASGWPPHKTYKWKDTTKLMDYGVNNYTRKEVVSPETEFDKIPVIESIEGGEITPYAKEGVSLLLNENEIVTYKIQLPEIIMAPVKKDATIGSITIFIDGSEYKVLPLYTREGKRLLTYEYVLKRLVRKYFKL